MRFVALASLFVSLFSINVVSAESDNHLNHEIHVQDPWIRLVPSVVKNGGAFISLSNMSDKDITFVGVKSSIAKRIEIHEHVMSGEKMKMQEVKGGLVIPAKGSVQIEPGSFHIMMMGLNQKMAAMETYTLTLVFDNGMELPVNFIVKNAKMEMNSKKMEGMNH